MNEKLDTTFNTEQKNESCMIKQCNRNKSSIHGLITRHVHDDGYTYIGINGNCYRADHLIWFFMKNKWPEEADDIRVYLKKHTREKRASLEKFFQDD